ncbi:hypothetical protein CcaverHIS002_0202120 [Cutaneotrichosporon cavernicola]|uniref:WD40 repeat-like protein n=1 Tax=Cutaneotrichosporon cavernicola TaxID=279322 RepID=A0AA48L1G0_9TREE|nr:uncharacterized protein CcaverHIS019_0202140 [Cutaneotrichosporon cavernicola]BEI81052.1 hypothetical protein CcaverHIS002_0202120 [Cutaneotrichosporon cavernicola]BEI88852.1 hypothetical protein CcaverHIS019_0202140 [Cutaneotrichosporon cavernicola]BEI96628.1 hypothetical protein CcaverHIS631_0202170 [Cutaneotrichosporon cavernicola]
MPPAPPVAFATLAAPLPSNPPVRGITPSSNHLVLRHGTEFITIADNQTLQAVERLERHTGQVTSVTAERGSIWSAGLDALVVQWDERSRRPAAEIKAFIKHPLPITALATHDLDNLVIAGTGSDSLIIFWDTRNTSEPAYTQATHGDDVTHLSLLPPTAKWTAKPEPLPSQLLLSGSKDGTVALSDLRLPGGEEGDAALVAAAEWGAVEAAGAYEWKGGMRVWARGDGVAGWNIVEGEEGGLEFVDQTEVKFEKKSLKTPDNGPSIAHPAEQERPYPAAIRINYLSAALPSMGVSRGGVPILGAGTDDGDIVLLHSGSTPTAFLMSGPEGRGHKGPVRAMHYATFDEALYTGSEDGVLAGWNLASIPRLVVGDPEVDDDGGDGREDIDSEDESEIESTTTEESDRSDRSDDESEDEEDMWGRRPVYGRER